MTIATKNLVRELADKKNAIMNISRDLARQVTIQHDEGIQVAVDMQASALDEFGEKARKNNLGIGFRNPAALEGNGTIVSIVDATPGERPRHWNEILVLTKQDELACTDNAIATPVSFTTRVLTIIVEDDGEKFLVEVWRNTTTKVVV